MSWQLYTRFAETALESGKVPSSQEIISLIKRVNPTSLNLSETDREYGYRLKDRLQNVLLENYGEAFHLEPHPCSPDIILIKHNTLPSVDACHADINSLSAKARDAVGDVATISAAVPARSGAKGKTGKNKTGCAPKEVLRTAELLLGQYDYPEAENLLVNLRIADSTDVPPLVKAASLLEEMGAYRSGIELLLAQPRQVLKDRRVRELLALSYYGNGMIPEARALFDAAHPGDLGKNALCAYADISLKDGNLARAYYLLGLSEQRDGFLTAHASLRKEIETAMQNEAEPFFLEAERAFARSDMAHTERSLHKALSLYPNFQKAQRLAASIEAGKSALEIKKLWDQFASSETTAARLDLLVQLQERDRGSGDRIKELMAREKARHKDETVAARLEALRALATQEQWEACFDVLLWLSREGEEAFRRACEVAPYFSVLYRNKRLMCLPDHEAKELWLKFVRLKRLAQQEPPESRWELVQELKQYFHGFAPFKVEYERAIELEQDKARDEAEHLFDRLEEMNEEEEPDLAEVKRLALRLRKRSAVLPAQESAPFKEYAETVLRRLERETENGGSILDYRESLLLGNLAKAAQLRESYSQPWEEFLNSIDDEIARKFAIAAEPLTLTVSPDPVDLTTESAPPVLTFVTSSDRHLLFREDDHSIVVVNLPRMTATRHRSPNFENLKIVDILADQDLFLFIDAETRNTVWRAVLSDTESRFTAVFNINEHFQYGEEAEFKALFMSSVKDNAYYALIADKEGVRFLKQNVSLDSSVEKSVEVTGDEPTAADRLSYRPDRFLVTTGNNTTVLESNLEPSRGCSRVGAGQRLYPLGIDRGKSRIYAMGDGIINVLNTKLRAVRQYLRATSSSHLIVTVLTNICVEKGTALLDIDGKGIFYDMETDRFSQKFSTSRVVQSETPSRTYYWDFDTSRSALILKDITDELDTLLEWRVLLTGEDEAAAIAFVETLENPELFTVVKSSSKPPTSDAAS